MIEQPKSLRVLRNELTGIRLAAANTSLWSIAATVNQRAITALNDAIRTYPIFIKGTVFSVAAQSSGYQVVLPGSIDRVLEVRARNWSGTAWVGVHDFKYNPSFLTNFLKVTLSEAVTSYWLEVDYETRITELPEQVSLTADFTSTTAMVSVSPVNGISGVWPKSGFIELYAAAGAGSGKREYMHYTSINPNVGFAGLTRSIAGDFYNFTVSTDSVSVSPVIVAPSEMIAVMMLEAEANMYRFWLSNRAMYDQYISLTGLQQLDIEELLTMSGALSAQAERRYRRLRKAPAPGFVQVRLRDDL